MLEFEDVVVFAIYVAALQAQHDPWLTATTRTKEWRRGVSECLKYLAERDLAL